MSLQTVHWKAINESPSSIAIRPVGLFDINGNEIGSSTQAPHIWLEVTPLPPLIDPSIVKINCRLNFTVAGNDIDRWIPNTNEDSRPFTIGITGENANGETVFLPENTNIILLSPEDPNFNQPGDPPNANIYKNKGTGFYFKSEGSADSERFASFESSNFRPRAIPKKLNIVNYT